MTPTAAVVIVTYNHLEDMRELLPQLMAQTLPGFVLVLSDNGSHDGTVQWVEQNHPSVVVVQNGGNLGFAGGCNKGIGVCLGMGVRYIALLNPDCRVGPSWLDELVRTAEQAEDIGICQSKIYLDPPSDPPVINTVGNMMHYTGIGMCGHLGEVDSPEFDDDGEIAYASGAAMLLRADVAEKIGTFDSKMFMYHEDFDLGVRAWIAGYRVVRSARSVAYHRYSFRKDARKFYLVDRNRIFSLLKVYQWRTILALAPALLVMEVGMLMHAISNGWFRLKLCSYLDVAGSLGRLSAERRRIQSTRVRGDGVLLAMSSRRLILPDGSSPRAIRLANLFFDTYFRLLRPIFVGGHS